MPRRTWSTTWAFHGRAMGGARTRARSTSLDHRGPDRPAGGRGHAPGGPARWSSGKAHQPGLDREARPLQQVGDPLGGQPVEVERDGVAEPLGQVQRLVAHLEGDEQAALGGQHPVELGERRRQQLRWAVDDRVPGDQAAEGSVGQVEGGHRALVETQGGVGPAGHRQHSRRQVDAERVQPQGAEVGGHVAGAAPDVGHRSGVAGRHQLGEGAEHRPAQWLGLQLAGEALGVALGDGVVGRPDGAQVRGLGHGGRTVASTPAFVRVGFRHERTPERCSAGGGHEVGDDPGQLGALVLLEEVPAALDGGVRLPLGAGDRALEDPVRRPG